jgi:hypothetical protein
MRNPALSAELVARAKAARSLEAELAAAGEITEAYPAALADKDAENAAFLMDAFAAHGWPGPTLVGDEGAAAAVNLLQRAVASPAAQRRGLELMLDAASVGEASAFDAAHFADRLAVFEGRGQVFGTQLEHGADGEIAVAPLAEPENVDVRRASVGLPPLAAYLQAARAQSPRLAPEEAARRRAAFESWARAVGWRG